MQARDVMTSPAVTVTPETTVQEIAKLLLEKKISAVPVVDAERKLVGVVSEGDLVHRAETGTERRRPWWLSWVIEEPEARARSYLKSHGIHAKDVMTRRVVTVSEDTALEEIASLLERHRIKRVPVVDEDGGLVGIVSRANLLQGLAVRKAEGPVSAGDHELRAALLDAIRDSGIDSHLVSVVVSEGVAHLWGSVETEDERRALAVAVENTPGLKGVDNQVGLLSRRRLGTV